MDAITKTALKLVVAYIGVMENYDAGFDITDPAHPHNEDWVKANELLRDAGYAMSNKYVTSTQYRAASADKKIKTSIRDLSKKTGIEECFLAVSLADMLTQGRAKPPAGMTREAAIAALRRVAALSPI